MLSGDFGPIPPAPVEGGSWSESPSPLHVFLPLLITLFTPVRKDLQAMTFHMRAANQEPNELSYFEAAPEALLTGPGSALDLERASPTARRSSPRVHNVPYEA